jgi:uncharacterized DUF497 family protein
VLIEYDAAKNARNIRERGLSFDRVADFDFEGALFAEDGREDYGEARYVGIGLLDDRVHVLCFTEGSRGIRVISFRKANAREVKRYEQAKSID